MNKEYNMENVVNIYKRIKEIADQLKEDNETWKRSDLAYELKDYGIENDSYIVSQLIWDAYNYYHQAIAIKIAYYNNARTKLIIDQQEFRKLMDAPNKDKCFEVIANNLNFGENTLDDLSDKLNDAMVLNSVIKGTGKVINTISGTRGVVKVQSDAKTVFNKYSTLINSYGNAKEEITNIISIFCQLRANIFQVYQNYSIALIDIFGDSIKAVDPQMFNYDSVQWLDIDGMFKVIELEYQNLSAKCTNLFNEISDSFTNSISDSSQIYRNSDNKKVGLVLAALNMASHYMDASQKTLSLKDDLLILKNNIRKDATTIKGDLGRLTIIYKMMNDLYIPTAEAFIKNCNLVFTNELDEIINSLYVSPNIAQIKTKRDDVLHECKLLESEILDAKFNIEYYSNHILECDQLLQSLEPSYREAKKSKPTKPFFLFNILSFGTLKKQYNRNIYDWNKNCSPVITKYEDLRVDAQIDKEELSQLKDRVKKNTEQIKDLRKEVDRLTKKMMLNINSNDIVKEAILNHLESIIALLKTAKEIIGLELDKKLTNTVTIIEYTPQTLPVEVKKGLQTLSNTINQSIIADQSTARTTMEIINSQTDNKEEIAENELQQISDAENVVIQKSLLLFEEWMKYRGKRFDDSLSEAHYNNELVRLQNEFQQNMKQIDNKSDILRKIIIKINTSQSKEELKEALLLIGNIDRSNLSDKDLNDFLSGRKTIEI